MLFNLFLSSVVIVSGITILLIVIAYLLVNKPACRPINVNEINMVAFTLRQLLMLFINSWQLVSFSEISVSMTIRRIVAN